MTTNRSAPSPTVVPVLVYPRECTVEDPGGHRWQLTRTLRDVAPEEWGGWSVGG